MIITNYNNGGYNVSIHSDGTKIREQISDSPPIYPESMDIKITNYCDLSKYCKWCHEGSNTKGKHADLDILLGVLEGLPKGVELAIGGGNPLSHPDLIYFLEEVKSRGLIANLTINKLHVNKHKQLITNLVANDLVKGIGITHSEVQDISWLENLTNNLVYHVIAGVHNHEDLLKMKKVLVLGYKQVRKGKSYFSHKVEDNLQSWIWNIRNYLGNDRIVSFDNLAIEQLKIKRFLTKEAWDSFYMGDDGMFTFYLDAVEQKYSLSSTSMERFTFDDNVVDMFQFVRNN